MALAAIIFVPGVGEASARAALDAMNMRVEWAGDRHAADDQCGHRDQHKHRCTRVARVATAIPESRPQRRFFYPVTAEALPSHHAADEATPPPRAGAPPTHLGLDYRQMYAATRRMLS